MIKTKTVYACFAGLLFASASFAATTLHIDGTFVRTSQSSDTGTGADISYRGYAGVVFGGSDEIHWGPFLQYANASSASDIVAGAMVRLGKRYFLELGGGWLKHSGGEESGDLSSGTGWAMVAAPGMRVELGNSILRVSVPFFYKKYTDVSKTELTPYIGIEWEI